jgi:release factor glutamine methyltransferase
MKTLAEVLQLSTSFLKGKGVEKARRTAEELLSFSLGMPRLDLYLQFDRPLQESELIPLREGLRRCALGEPVEYVLGTTSFYGCEISLDARVLIPRPETEILVDSVVKAISSKSGVLWDLCTGSGCVGISLKKKMPTLQVVLSDLSRSALELALENGRKNGVEVGGVEGDLLEPFKGKKADFIVCNPPYLSAREYAEAPVSVKNFEPKGALLAGERGTEFYERLAVGLPPLLNPQAKVFLEIGALQGDAVRKIFSSGPWVSMTLQKDWAGLDRFFFLETQ